MNSRQKQKFGFSIQGENGKKVKENIKLLEDKYRSMDLSYIQAHKQTSRNWRIYPYQPVLTCFKHYLPVSTSINHREASTKQFIGHYIVHQANGSEELKKADLESHLARLGCGQRLVDGWVVA